MPRMQPLDPATATGETKELLETVKKKMGRIPNILRTMANSPAALKCYLGMSGALAEASISPELRELIALAIGEYHGCDYCVAAHTALGAMQGLSEEEMLAARRGTSTDTKAQAALKFAMKLTECRAEVTAEDVKAVRDAGFSDGEIAEIIACVSLNIYTNYFNHVADTECDFPAAPEL